MLWIDHASGKWPSPMIRFPWNIVCSNFYFKTKHIPVNVVSCRHKKKPCTQTKSHSVKSITINGGYWIQSSKDLGTHEKKLNYSTIFITESRNLRFNLWPLRRSPLPLSSLQRSGGETNWWSGQAVLRVHTSTEGGGEGLRPGATWRAIWGSNQMWRV